MKRDPVLRDVVAAAAVAVLALILAPGLAIVAVVAIVVLAACLIGAVRSARGGRPRTASRAGRPRRRPDRRNLSARRPTRR